MRRLALVSLHLFALACAASAQDAAAARVVGRQSPPGVVVIRLKWAREVQAPRGWDRAPFDASVGRAQTPAPPSGPNRHPVPSSPFPQSGRLPYVYHYTAKIRNDGAKEIRVVLWEYVVTDPDSRKELGRHRFYSREKIGEREQATLRGKSVSAPSKVVSAKGLEKDGRSPFDESFEVRCVMYADGSWWAHPSAGETECFSLKRREKFYRRANAW